VHRFGGEHISPFTSPDIRRIIMGRKSIPKGPWDNGVHDDGQYNAVVHSIEHGAYGRGEDYYFRIILWLVEKRVFMVTNIYVREEDSQTALQRIWHFCRACGTSNEDFYKRLSEFKGKHVRVTLFNMTPEKSGAAGPFSDVDRFLKPTRPLTKDEWVSYRQATGQGTECAVAKEKPEKKNRIRDIFAS
jgi:hypothetical protein